MILIVDVIKWKISIWKCETGQGYLTCDSDYSRGKDSIIWQVIVEAEIDALPGSMRKTLQRSQIFIRMSRTNYLGGMVLGLLYHCNNNTGGRKTMKIRPKESLILVYYSVSGAHLVVFWYNWLLTQHFNSLISLFFLLKTFIYLKDGVHRVGRKGGDIFHQLFYFPNGCSNWASSEARSLAGGSYRFSMWY